MLRHREMCSDNMYIAPVIASLELLYEIWYDEKIKIYLVQIYKAIYD
jgi:hypothetical protein